MRQGVILYVMCSLAMGWSKTVIISKDRRVIADLGERKGVSREENIMKRI